MLSEYHIIVLLVLLLASCCTALSWYVKKVKELNILLGKYDTRMAELTRTNDWLKYRVDDNDKYMKTWCNRLFNEKMEVKDETN